MRTRPYGGNRKVAFDPTRHPGRPYAVKVENKEGGGWGPTEWRWPRIKRDPEAVEGKSTGRKGET